MAEKFTEDPLLTKRFDRAFKLASDHHRKQLRKGTEIPYMAHLLGVTAIVLEIGGDEDEAIGGLLHDAVEDGGGPEMLDHIRKEFGSDVADIVEANSDTDIEPKPPWEARKRDYVAAIAHKSVPALRVSLADKLHNARAIATDMVSHGDAVFTRFSAPQDRVHWYYAALAAAFDTRRDDLGPQAGVAIDELGRLAAAMKSPEGGSA